MKIRIMPGSVAYASFLLSLFFWVIQFHGKLPAVTDEFLFSYPSQAVNLAEWYKGFLPLWNAGTGCGMPQLANDLSACLYPPFWIFLLTGLSHWLVWMTLAHTAFAFLGFYLWARSLKISDPWAILGAISFAGSLHMTRIWAYPMFSAAQSWTPWIFFTAGRFLEEGKRCWWLALVLAIGLQILAGYPFFSFYTLFFLMVWIFFKPIGSQPRLAVVGAIVTALALTAAQVLPFADYLSYSVRGGWGTPDRFPYFSRGMEFKTLFSPTALGIPGTTSYQGQGPNGNFMMYFGLIPLVAWAGGFLFPRRVKPRFWNWAALGWLLWMMGGVFPLWRIIPESLLEGLNPSKAVGVFLFTVLTGAGLGLTCFFQGRFSAPVDSAVKWGITCFWLLDVLSIPFRTVFPVADPYQKPETIAWAQKIKDFTQGQRMVSLRVKNRLVAYGTGEKKEAFGLAADLWVGDLLANANDAWGIRTSHAYVSTWTRGMDRLWKVFNQSDRYKERMADLAGVRVLSLPITLESPHYKVLEKDGDDFLLLNERCMPDAWVAESSKEFGDRENLLAQLEAETSQALPSGTVYLEKGEGLPPPGREQLNPGGIGTSGWERPIDSRARFTGDFSHKNLSGEGSWLVWNEAYTPGWRSWVDGKPSPISRAFGFFMAVPAPSGGNHEIVLRYEPASFRLGLFVSLLSLWLAFAALAWNKPERLTGNFPLSFSQIIG